MCISTEEVGWCVLLLNFSNDGHSASGTAVSTFVKDDSVWTGSLGAFKIVSSQSTSRKEITFAEISDYDPVPAAQCRAQCHAGPDCNCAPGKGCYCCADRPMSTCVQLGGVVDLKFMQATVFFNGLTWFMSSSQVARPQSICAINSEMTGTLCLVFNNLNFNRGIDGDANLVYIVGQSHSPIGLGAFHIE